MMKFSIFLALLFFFNLSCTTHPHSEGMDSYRRVIQKNSAGDKQFAGLYHNFEFRSTLLTTEVSKAIHDRMNVFYQWSDEESQQKLTKTMDELDQKTKIWLSFFTPESKNDNLANKVSIWKVYLHANGQRYEGRAYKANKNLGEAKALFPYHNRWATAYYVDFEVPTTEVEGGDVKLVITGPLGRREVMFQ